MSYGVGDPVLWASTLYHTSFSMVVGGRREKGGKEEASLLGEGGMESLFPTGSGTASEFQPASSRI